MVRLLTCCAAFHICVYNLLCLCLPLPLSLPLHVYVGVPVHVYVPMLVLVYVCVYLWVFQFFSRFYALENFAGANSCPNVIVSICM